MRGDAVNDASVLATLTDGMLAVNLLVRFGKDGLLEAVYADSRERVENRITSAAPWEGRFWNYAVRSVMRMPLDGEVARLLPEGIKSYFRSITIELSYEFAS